MFALKDLWSRALFQRQDNFPIPALCYKQCNNILIDIEAGGKTPTICDNSTVENDFSSCNGCVDANLWNPSSYIPSSSLGEFISYCQNVGNNSFWNSTPTASMSTSASASTSTSTSSPSATPTSTAPRSTDPRLRAIVPAVVVPVVVVVVAIIIISITVTLIARRRRRVRQRGQAADDSTLYGIIKAELPGEEKNRHELDARGNRPVRELEDTSPQELPVPVIISELSFTPSKTMRSVD